MWMYSDYVMRQLSSNMLKCNFSSRLCRRMPHESWVFDSWIDEKIEKWRRTAGYFVFVCCRCRGEKVKIGRKFRFQIIAVAISESFYCISFFPHIFSFHFLSFHYYAFISAFVCCLPPVFLTFHFHCVKVSIYLWEFSLCFYFHDTISIFRFWFWIMLNNNITIK